MTVWLYSIFYQGLQKNRRSVYTVMETELVLNVSAKPTPDNSLPVQAPAEPTKCCNCLTSRLKDQDFMQKFNVSISFILELYRVLMGTMLIMFVPQKCGEDMCGLTDNMFKSTDVYSVNAGINIATLIAFVYLYVVEVRRENTLITYLDINKEFACDNDAVGEALLLLPNNKRQTVLNLDHKYQHASYIALFFFLANTIFSGYSVYKNYLDSKTTSVFITNVLFLAGKLIQTNSLANTEENVFYSAYLTDRIQYNYVDPDKISIEHQSAEISLSYETTYSVNSV